MNIIQAITKLNKTGGIYACLHGQPFYITIEKGQYIGKNDPVIFIPKKNLYIIRDGHIDFAFIWQYGSEEEYNVYHSWNYNFTWSFNKEDLIPFFEK